MKKKKTWILWAIAFWGGWHYANQKLSDMEEKMKNMIMADLSQYRQLAQRLNEDAFTEAVYNSFKQALSAKHYVAIMPVDLDDTFTDEQHKDLAKFGYHQVPNEDMFSNMFVACQHVIDQMVDVLRNKEDMSVDKCCDPRGKVVYVVSLFGVKDSHFERDFSAAPYTEDKINE